MQPELTSELSARQWRWLIERVGVERATGALARAVARGRRPWPLNAARELGLKPPTDERFLPPASEPSGTSPAAMAARAALARMRGR